jgi:hypothetical protein
MHTGWWCVRHTARLRKVTEVNGCTCDVSIMTDARAGNVACGHCAGYWMRGGRPLAIDPGNATAMRDFIAAGGVIAWQFTTGGVTFVGPDDVVTAPGKARLEACPDCAFAAKNGRACDCDGSGIRLFHACIECGDPAMWAFDGDRAHLRCDLCGARWDVTHPEWIGQRIPASVMAIT